MQKWQFLMISAALPGSGGCLVSVRGRSGHFNTYETLQKNPVDVTEKVTLSYSLPLSEGLWFARAEFGKLCRCRKVAGSLDSFHITIDTIGT